MTKMKLARLLAVPTMFAAAFGLLGCAGGNTSEVVWHDNGQPEFINSHDTWWSYQFVYHPYADVYYEPFSRTYYCQDGGGWVSAQTLPPHMELDHDSAQVVYLRHQHPILQHQYTLDSTWPVYDPPRKHASAPYSYGY